MNQYFIEWNWVELNLIGKKIVRTLENHVYGKKEKFKYMHRIYFINIIIKCLILK